jgi:hypothetical protein
VLFPLHRTRMAATLFRSAQRVCLLLCGCPCGHASSRMLAMCAEDTAAMPLSCPLAPKMCSSSMYLAWRDCVQASNATVPTNKTAHTHGRLVRSTACHQRGVPFAHVGWDQRAACVARLRLTDPGVVLCCSSAEQGLSSKFLSWKPSPGGSTSLLCIRDMFAHPAPGGGQCARNGSP